MSKYGSDKPDIRFGMEINDITSEVKDSEFVVFKSAIDNGGSVRAIKVENAADMGRKKLDKFGEFVKTYRAKGLAWIACKEDGIKSPIAKFFSEEQMQDILNKVEAKTGDLVLIVADKDNIALQSLGALRLHVAKELEILKDNKEFNFVWITEFPLFDYSEEENRYIAAHHPFTMPMDEDLQYLESDPGRVRAKAYDIVLNGEELGGGSIRIHSSELQETMFKVLGFTTGKGMGKIWFLIRSI